MLVDGREFTFLGLEPYTRKDGAETTLRVWRASCATHGCSNTWEFKTPAGRDPAFHVPDPARPPGGHAFSHHLCKDCYAPGDRKPMRTPEGGWKWAKTSDEDVAEIRRLAASGVPYSALSLCYPIKPGTIREIVKGRRR